VPLENRGLSHYGWRSLWRTTLKKLSAFIIALLTSVAGANLKSIVEYDHKTFLPKEKYLEQFAAAHKNIPLKKFFEDREKQDSPAMKKCRADLRSVGKEYFNFYQQHNYLAADEVRIKFTTLMNQCGHCVTTVTRHPTAKTIYLSHGACYVPGTPAQQVAGQKIANEFLLNMDRYPVQNDGFRYLVAFDGINPTTGKKLPPAESIITKNPFLAFIAVRGPSNYAFSYLSESYFLDRQYKLAKGDGGRELILQFKSVKVPPPGFERPSLYDYPPNPNTGFANTVMPLRDVVAVRGQWYVDSEGYLNYVTEADFGKWGNIPLGWYAEMVSQDTVWGLSVRMFFDQVKAYYF
jgi:hypothetical protein